MRGIVLPTSALRHSTLSPTRLKDFARVSYDIKMFAQKKDAAEDRRHRSEPLPADRQVPSGPGRVCGHFPTESCAWAGLAAKVANATKTAKNNLFTFFIVLLHEAMARKFEHAKSIVPLLANLR